MAYQQIDFATADELVRADQLVRAVKEARENLDDALQNLREAQENLDDAYNDCAEYISDLAFKSGQRAGLQGFTDKI